MEAWVGMVWDRLPALGPPPRIDWSRTGLASIHERLEVLKTQALQWDAVLDEAGRMTALARGWVMTTEHVVDDQTAANLARRSGQLVSQGMAWEERRLTYQTSAIDQVIWQRRFTLALQEVEAVANEARNRHYGNRAERTDLSTQTRLIQVGLEIGELA